MALRPKQQRDTLDQTRATKSSIVVVRIAVITKKKRHKKVSIVAVIQPTTITEMPLILRYCGSFIYRHCSMPRKGIFIAVGL